MGFYDRYSRQTIKKLHLKGWSFEITFSLAFGLLKIPAHYLDVDAKKVIAYSKWCFITPLFKLERWNIKTEYEY